jgi:hypothetical protein
VILSLFVTVSVAVTMFVFTVLAKISVTIMVPVVVVFNSTSLPGPVTRKVLRAIVVRRNPNGSQIRTSSPVTLVPAILVPHRIPIAFHPHKIWPRLRRLKHYARWRWRPNHDSDRNLRLRPNG